MYFHWLLWKFHFLYKLAARVLLFEEHLWKASPHVFVADGPVSACDFLKRFGFGGRFCSISTIIHFPSGVTSIVLSIFPTALCTGRFCTCFDSFTPLLVSYISRFKSFLLIFTLSHFLCCFRLWKLPHVIRLNRFQESISVFGFVQRTARAIWCPFGDWVTFRKRIRPLRHVHKPFFFSILLKSLLFVRDYPGILG